MATEKDDIRAATALGKACDAAVKRYMDARTPRNAHELQRLVATVYLSGAQQTASAILRGADEFGAKTLAEQMNRATHMVAEAMGFTKQTGREQPGADKSRLILPGDNLFG